MGELLTRQTDFRHICFFIPVCHFKWKNFYPLIVHFLHVFDQPPHCFKNRPLGVPQHCGLPLKSNGKKCPSPRKSIHYLLCLALVFVWSSAFQPDTFHSKIVFISFLNSAAAFTVLCPSCLQCVWPFPEWFHSMYQRKRRCFFHIF